MNIKSYPRNVSATVRREDSTRKEARERRKQRKEEELQKRREEVKRLKALKLRELRKKLERIGKEGGRQFDDDPGTLTLLPLPSGYSPPFCEQHFRILI
jgi:protein KRI1